MKMKNNTNEKKRNPALDESFERIKKVAQSFQNDPKVIAELLEFNIF